MAAIVHHAGRIQKSAAWQTSPAILAVRHGVTGWLSPNPATGRRVRRGTQIAQRVAKIRLGVTMTVRVDDFLSFQKTALGLRAQRQQVLAANIANADTPNYKARDFDFSTALRDAVAGRQGADLTLAVTSSGHLPGSSAGGVSARLMYRTPAQAAIDGNTVEMDVERSAFSENAIQYEAGITFISHHLKTLLSAVQSS